MRIDLPQAISGRSVVGALKSAATSINGEVEEFGHKNSYVLALAREVTREMGLFINISCGNHRRARFFSLESPCTKLCQFVLSPIQIDGEITSFDFQQRLHPYYDQGGGLVWSRLETERDIQIARGLFDKLMTEFRKNIPS